MNVLLTENTIINEKPTDIVTDNYGMWKYELAGWNKIFQAAQDNISGLKVFDGEDLEYQDRMRLQTLQQNAWIQQQKYENEIKAQQERDEERRYAEQTLAINRMRSMLEAEHEQKIRDMNSLTSNYNRKLSQMKREKDAKDKYDEDQLDQYNIQDAEDTRNRAYNRMKMEIDQAISEI